MHEIDHAIYNLECLIERYLKDYNTDYAKQALSELAGYVDAKEGGAYHRNRLTTWPGYYRDRYDEGYITGCNLLKVKGE